MRHAGTFKDGACIRTISLALSWATLQSKTQNYQFTPFDKLSMVGFQNGQPATAAVSTWGLKQMRMVTIQGCGWAYVQLSLHEAYSVNHVLVWVCMHQCLSS
jgi:hypothetical protein